MKFTYLWQGCSIAMLALLVACNPRDVPQADASAAKQAAQTQVAERRAPEPEPVCATCGVVASITEVTQEGQGTGVGAVAGAVVGGIAGRQVGGGTGRDIATVAGAIGGAVLGNEIEENRRTSSHYEVVIDMESGGEQVITVADASGIAVGSEVTVQGGNISLR